MNRINLYFDKSLSHIAESPYGQEVYLNQIDTFNKTGYRHH